MPKSADEHSPWASGPGEILRHGLDLLKKDSDRNRRLAMISVDNAVELMMKTYLGLPRRVTGLTITRKEFEEAAESFPRLLDALERFASDRLTGIEMGNIEWYHRLRNELYHQGNGLTVERARVEVYAGLAKVLFTNLFGVPVPDTGETAGDEATLFQFLATWNQLERLLVWKTATVSQGEGKSHANIRIWQNWLPKSGDLKPDDLRRLRLYQQLRNAIVLHGDLSGLHAVPTEELERLLKELRSRWDIDDDGLPGQ